MLKMILLLMIVLTCSYGGIVYGESFKKRHNQLKEILKAITLLQNDVLYGSTPLPEALDRLKDKVDDPLKTILDKASVKLFEGKVKSVYEAFVEEFEFINKEFYLNESDTKIVADFLRSLGECGVYGQENIFNLAVEGLKINLKDADESAKKNTKLYRYLGVCFGIMIAIFFI